MSTTIFAWHQNYDSIVALYEWLSDEQSWTKEQLGWYVQRPWRYETQWRVYQAMCQPLQQARCPDCGCRVPLLPSDSELVHDDGIVDLDAICACGGTEWRLVVEDETCLTS